jgi:hypothetical protein
MEDEDPMREGRAYAYSIYLMLGVPYLVLGVFGVLVYRGLNRRTPGPGERPPDAPPSGEVTP